MNRKILLILTVTVIGVFATVFSLSRENLKAIEGATTAAPTITPTVTPTPWQTPQSKFYAPILLYHHIASVSPQQSYYVSPEIFDAQMKWLRDEGYTVVSMDDLVKAAEGQGGLPPKPVVLTFDDGVKDQITNGVPILEKYHYPATFFIKLNNLGKGGVTLEDLKALQAAGHTIGSHSVNHDNMAKMPEETLNYELRHSKQYLEENLGTKIKYFSFPGGAYSKETLAAVKAAGYEAAVSTRHEAYQNIKDENSIFILPRIHIDDEMPTFTDWVQGKNLY